MAKTQGYPCSCQCCLKAHREAEQAEKLIEALKETDTNAWKHHALTEINKRDAELAELQKQLESWSSGFTAKRIAELQSQNARLKEALKHIAAGTYSSFPIEYKDLCKAMMTIADNTLQQLSNQGESK